MKRPFGLLPATAGAPGLPPMLSPSAQLTVAARSASLARPTTTRSRMSDLKLFVMVPVLESPSSTGGVVSSTAA